MLNKMFWGFLAFAFPWLVLLIYDNPGGAVVALFMQATLIGWPPATIWAMRTVKENQALKKKKFGKE
ncbi:hypothetical protein ACQUW5_09795 [Legionella sp. CNM-1927-20]|uniref:hypothetical protein n=1 Tax=Legionella sp. CNM-1927-20 TaxID=3422221 RepID=UPI00403A9CC6